MREYICIALTHPVCGISLQWEVKAPVEITLLMLIKRTPKGLQEAPRHLSECVLKRNHRRIHGRPWNLEVESLTKKAGSLFLHTAVQQAECVSRCGVFFLGWPMVSISITVQGGRLQTRSCLKGNKSLFWNQTQGTMVHEHGFGFPNTLEVVTWNFNSYRMKTVVNQSVYQTHWG